MMDSKYEAGVRRKGDRGQTTEDRRQIADTELMSLSSNLEKKFIALYIPYFRADEFG